jgi:transcription initiation factor IIE alpha subunit
MSEVLCKMEDTRSVEKKAEFQTMNIMLKKAISSQSWSDYRALKNLENNLKKMKVRSVYYCRNGLFSAKLREH